MKRMWNLFFLATGILAGWARLGADPVVEWIYPSDVDADITEFDFRHMVATDPEATPRDSLFVMLPGTNGAPVAYQEIVKTAAGAGFHAIGLTYNNGEAVNDLCALTFDSNCHGTVRHEIIFGEDTSALVEVDPTHSLIQRLVGLLQYLADASPDAGWEQFLVPETQLPLWESIVVAGHSQGAGHAGFLSRQFLLQRCIQFAGTDWWGRGQRPSDWILQPGATPPERIFALGHPDDASVSPDVLYPTWEAYGLETFGPVSVVDDAPSPVFDYSHRLMTEVEPMFSELTGEASAHGAMVTDLYTPLDANGVPVLKPVWLYLLTGPDNPVQDVLTQSIHLGAQVFELDAWPLIRAEAFPWIWTDPMGWWWLDGNDTDGLWIYDPSWGFFWTTNAAFPHLWRHATGSWYFLDSHSQPEPWLFDHTSQSWHPARP